MSRREKRMKKQERRAAKAMHKQQAMHLQLNGFSGAREYANFWRGIQHDQDMSKKNKKEEKPEEKKEPEPTIYHSEYISCPYDWEITRMDAATRKKVVTSSFDKKVKRDLFMQGEALFICENSLTQKLTPVHRITIIDANGKRFPECTISDVMEWMTERQIEVKKKLYKNSK